MTTKLSNPHYTPEIQVKVSLLNFTITETGLEEQLLNVVVTEELPDLANTKASLILSNAQMNKQLYDIESEILYLLSNSQGNILDDTTLIETLASSKSTSEEIKLKMKESQGITEEIVIQSNSYRIVAKRAALLYFVLSDLSMVDPMYQYSLQWFSSLFVRSISLAAKSSDVTVRAKNLNDFFTEVIYNNICRSLFERHKLLFSFTLCVKILQGERVSDNDSEEKSEFRNDLYRFLLSGISPISSDDNSAGSKGQMAMPSTSWLEENVWSEMCQLSILEPFKSIGFLKEFITHIKEWQDIFDSSDPHHRPFPSPCDNLPPLERLCVLRCLRKDKIELGIQDFVVKYLGEKFITPPLFDLKACFIDSITTTPLIFVLSSGSDPNKDLDILAEELKMTKRLKRIALGQGQGPKAAAMIEKGLQYGDW